MAGSYVLPQIRVFQEFARTPNDVTQNLNPFLIGPNYQLMRYSSESERADCRSADYKTGTDLPLTWSDRGYSGSTPDKSWYGVTMADAKVALGDAMHAARGFAGDTTVPYGASTTTGVTRLEFTLTGNKSLIGTNAASLEFGVAVKPGDYLAYQDDSNVWQFAKILDISGGTHSDSKEISASIRQKGSTATAPFTVATAGYHGDKDVTVHLTVTAEHKLTWSSSIAALNSSAPTSFTSGTAVPLGLGLTITPTAAPSDVAAGQYELKVTLVEPYVRDTVTVASYVPINKEFTFVRHVDAADVVSDYVTLTSSGVSVAGNAMVDIGLYKNFKVVTATAYLNQRNLRTDHTDGVYTLGSDADIIRELGAYVPENPLAYGAHIMLLNSANKRIRYIGIPSVDDEGFATALKRASVTNDVYAFCPLTEDAGIIDSVVADCKRLSTEDEKSWRIAFFSKPTPETEDVTPGVGDDFELCKVAGTGNKTLTCYDSSGSTASTLAAFTEDVREDDVVTVYTSSGPVTARVAAVTSNNTLTLKDAVPDASSAACRFRILHKRGRAEYVEAIAATSEYFKHRRAYNVFPNNLRDSSGNYVEGMYAAAAVCALACSVQPQQPITNVEINGFSDLSDVYSKFSRDELNTIAAGGTLILMQDKKGGPVYVRHQISTAYSDGDLNSTELSLVKNLDSISYYFANRFAPYHGRYNVSDDLITEIRGIIEDGLAHLETTTETNKLIGPQVLAEGTEIRALYRDPDEKDRVYANVALNLPAPFNNFDLHLQVI